MCQGMRTTVYRYFTSLFVCLSVLSYQTTKMTYLFFGGLIEKNNSHPRPDTFYALYFVYLISNNNPRRVYTVFKSLFLLL